MRRTLNPGRLLLAFAAAASIAAAAPAGPHAPPPPPHAAASHHTAYRARVNPHLHGVTRPDAARPHPGERARHWDHPYWYHTYWYPSWNAYAWFAFHRGTGVIQGVVRNGSGSPLAAMTVQLRDRHGHALHSTYAKHYTSTGSGGVFLMTRVRSGSYRVRADGDGRSGHTAIHLNAGQVLEVAVKV